MFGNLYAIENNPFASVPIIHVSISLSERLIIIQDKLFGTRGMEYLSISTNVFLLKSFLLMNCGKCNFIRTIKAVTEFAIVLDHNNPFTPNLKLTINTTFNTIVEAPKIKFEREYSLIFPVPLASALLSPIRTFDIINSKNTTVYSYFIIPITIPAIMVNSNVPMVVYVMVAVITLSIVTTGNKNTDNVTKKSYVPYSAGLNFDVYSGNNKNDIICVLNFPIAIITVFFNNCFF